MTSIEHCGFLRAKREKHQKNYTSVDPKYELSCSVMGNLSESEDCIRKKKRICFFDSRPCGPGPMGPMEPMGVIRVKRVFKKSPLGT